MSKTFEISSSSSKSPSVGTKKVRKPREASGFRGAKDPAEGPSSGNHVIYVG